jgi:hypothetical protein
MSEASNEARNGAFICFSDERLLPSMGIPLSTKGFGRESTKKGERT